MTGFYSTRLLVRQSFIPVFLFLLLFTATACQSDSNAREAAPIENQDESRSAQPDPVPDQRDSARPDRNLSMENDLDNAPSAPLHEATRDVMAPDFSLPALDGSTFQLSDHFGKVIVVNFWATWCPPCRHEIPDFIELQNELGEKGLLFVGISLDEEGFDVVRPFVEEYGVNYPMVVDDGTAAQQYGPIAAMPTTFVINREGLVRRYAPGMLTKEALRPVLVQMLNENA